MSESHSETDKKDRKDAVPDPEDRKITGAIPADEDSVAGKDPADPDKEGEERFDAG